MIKIKPVTKVAAALVDPTGTGRAVTNVSTRKVMGRPRVHKSAAEKQKAYRERRKGRP